MRPAALLFDLDGTLLDSAPDLAAAANELLAAHGRAPLPYGRLRPHAGSGARGMLGTAFGLKPGDADYEPLRDRFLDLYEQRMFESTRPFDGVEALLTALDRQGLRWGIVTNKALRFARPQVAAMGLKPSADVLIGGDSTPHTKPHPAPLLAAAAALGVPPADCVYVGDDLRDMHAAQAAGMAGWAATWGYLGVDEPPQAWPAAAVLDSPREVLIRLGMA